MDTELHLAAPLHLEIQLPDIDQKQVRSMNDDILCVCVGIVGDVPQ